MKFSLKLLRRILPGAQFNGFNDDQIFDILNVAHLRQFEAAHSAHTLYFVVYEDDPSVEGWYNHPFDRSSNIPNFRNDENISFILDDRVPLKDREGLRHIYVDNIWDAINKLRSYVMACSKAKVVGITGSVGKTTCAALVEDILQTTFQCKRIYSKRLTPLTLSSWLINFLEPTDEILILEYSMYRPDHIKKLTDLVCPDYAIFLNVERMHLGVQGIDTIEDIVTSKSALTQAAKVVSILNKDDKSVMSTKSNFRLTFSLDDPSADAYVVHDTDTATISISDGKCVSFIPYIRTKLFLQQALATTLLAHELGVSTAHIELGLTNFHPEEHRIQWIQLQERNVLFDADVTISGRLKALAENMYATSSLVVVEFDFGEENVQLQVNDFNTVFSLFSQVSVLATTNNRDIISRYNFKGINFVDRMTIGSTHDFVVVHYGTYFRKHADMSASLKFF